MPETAVNENDLVKLPENEVWPPGHATNVKAVSEPHPMCHSAYDHFWSRVFSSNTGHALTSFLPRERIHMVHLNLRGLDDQRRERRWKTRPK
jgi:hypothetical protein